MENDGLAGTAARLLHEKVRRAAASLGYKRLLPVQEAAIPVIMRGRHTLITAPTGSGKTEAAFLPVLSLLIRSIEEEGDPGGVRVIYITPLRALNRDVTIRLERLASLVGVSILLRHGDTGQAGRRRFLSNPPHVMVTTPESLNLLLTVGDPRRLWSNVQWVIVDEVHELVDNKRGSELSVVLERLERLSRRRIQRIGLSATLSRRTIEEAKRLLASNRLVEVVADTTAKKYEVNLRIVSPSAEDERLWIKAVEEILEIARSTRGSVLVFTNTRSTAEKLAATLRKMVEDRGLGFRVEVHHGSLSRSVRESVEADFRSGKVKVLVATSSMELGIDIGYVDVVVQFMSPRQVTTMVQRAGRAGHRLEETSRAYIVTLNNVWEILESGVIAFRAEKGALEDFTMHRNPYDVAAHQAAGILLEEGGETSSDLILSILNASGALSTLTVDELDEILYHLDGVRVLRYDPETGRVRMGRRTRTYFYRTSMIPEENAFTVYNVATGEKIGEVSERFVESKLLDVGSEREMRFILGGKAWQAVTIDYEKGRIDAVLLGEIEGLLPSWEGELIPVSRKVAREVCSILSICMSDAEDCRRMLEARKIPEPYQSRIVEVAASTREMLGAIISHSTVVVEEAGGASILYACLGSNGNLALALLLSRLLERRRIPVEFHYTPYAIVFTSPAGVRGDDVASALRELAGMDPVERMVHLQEALRKSKTYLVRFLWVAKRMGVLEPGKRVPLSIIERLKDNMRGTIVDREAVKEILHDKLDVEALNEYLAGIREVRVVRLQSPTPLGEEVLSNPYLRLDVAVHIKKIAMDKIVESIKKSLARKTVRMLCLSCGRSKTVRVAEVEKGYRCPYCGSRLVAPLPDTEYGERLVNAYLKSRRGERLRGEEKKLAKEVLERAKLYLSYAGQGAGRYVVEALMTYGVGVDRAKGLLVALFERGERAFYDQLLKAMQDYALTRQYWDRRGKRVNKRPGQA